ncbi:MAG TPA: helix-turn-helix domain-containing protein, partial [bacterium]|nr:helix-turn-helix domain-containing protein [bacterium]
ADLLYRLKVYTLQLPPLRERPQDVEALARFFHAQFQRENGRRADPLPKEIIRALQAYAWPGNIRELKNAMERFCIQQGHQAPGVEHLPAEIRGPQALAAPAAAASTTAAVPPQTSPLQALLERHRWNKTKAALELGVSRPTFLKRLKEAGIE